MGRWHSGTVLQGLEEAPLEGLRWPRAHEDAVGFRWTHVVSRYLRQLNKRALAWALSLAWEFLLRMQFEALKVYYMDAGALTAQHEPPSMVGSTDGALHLY